VIGDENVPYRNAWRDGGERSRRDASVAAFRNGKDRRLVAAELEKSQEAPKALAEPPKETVDEA
jgi:hypothetical protein